MTNPSNAFASMVPGFDFLQGLVKSAGAAMPGVGQWVAPTLDPEELDKRINDLRTVQFWLEQNARLLGATIQALEVQRMTLSTLKTMNVSFADLTDSLKIRMPGQTPAPEAAAPAPSPAWAATPPPPPAPAPAPAADAAPPLSTGVIDPMQWWGALTQQFTQLAASALQDNATDSARHTAGSLVQQGLDAATETFRQAAAVPAAVAKTVGAAAQSLAGTPAPARKAAQPGKPGAKSATRSATKSTTHSAARQAPVRGGSKPR